MICKVTMIVITKDSNKISILSTFIEVLNPLDLPFFLNQIYHKYQNNLGKQTLQKDATLS